MIYCLLVPEVPGGSKHEASQKCQHGSYGGKNKTLQETLLNGTAAWCETPDSVIAAVETTGFFTRCCQILQKPLQSCKPHKCFMVL